MRVRPLADRWAAIPAAAITGMSATLLFAADPLRTLTVAGRDRK